MAALWLLLLHSLLSLWIVPASASPAVFSLDIHPHRDPDGAGRRLRRRGTVLEGLTARDMSTLYVANLTVGTPAQSVGLQITINASDSWVLAANSTQCTSASDCVGGSFDANSSSTYEYISSDFAITYLDGTSGKGDYVTETVSIGGASLTNQQIAVVNEATSLPLGILGLGFMTQEVQFTTGGQQYANIPQAMANEGIINSNAYSLWLNDIDSGNGSVLFGGIDTDKFKEPLMTIPLAPRPANTSDLLVSLTGVSIGDTVLLRDGSINVSLDTGTTLTYLPSNITEPLFSLVGATYDARSGVASIDCSQRDNKTVIDFSLSWIQLKLTIQELVIPNLSGSSQCWFGVTATTDGGIDTLGLTFLRSVYVVYDLSNQEISIAPALFNVTTSNILEISNGPDGVPGAIRTPVSTSSASTPAGTSTQPPPNDKSASPTSTPSDTSSPSSGLSAGASAGIGVGAGLGAIALAAGLLFYLWRRRRQAKDGDAVSPDYQYSEVAKAELPAESAQSPGIPNVIGGDGKRVSELPSGADSVSRGGRPAEVSGSGPPVHELE